MGLKPLPHLFDVVNHVQFEESRKLLNRSNTSLGESSALAVRGPQEERKNKWCNYCKKKGHVKEECWKLHGKPSTSKPQSHLTSTEQKEEDTTSLSPKELQLLRRILEKQNKSNSVPSVNLVQSGNSIIALNAVRTSDTTWIVDSGATDHMTGNRTLFTSLKLCSANLRVKVANGVFTKVEGIGTVTLSNSLRLHNVLFVPALTCNLISVSKLTKGHICRVIFDDDVCLFQDLNSGKTIGTSKEWDGLFYLERSEIENQTVWNARKALISSSSQDKDVLLWHCRSGHPSFDYMRHVFPNLFNKDSVPFHCETCQLAKQTRSSYPKQSYRPSTPFQLIHSDIWGPARTKTRTHDKWFVTFIDDHTRLTWVYLMKEKSEVAQAFQSFYHFVHNQFHSSIKILRSDNGREYLSSAFKEFLDQHGIHHQTSCPYTPQQNGVAERKNRHLLEVTRTLLMERHVPTIFWGDAVLTAAYLINRMPSKVLNYATPIQTLLTTFPNCPLLNPLPQKVFGCVVFVHNPDKSKFDARSQKCIFLGYSSTQKGYKCYCPTTQKLYVSKDTVFYEETAYYSQLPIQGESSEIEWLMSPEPTSKVHDTSNITDTLAITPVVPNTLPTRLDNIDTLPSTSPNTPPDEQGTQVEIITRVDAAEGDAEEDNRHQSQEAERNVNPTLRNDHESSSSLDPKEIGWPIALRKGVRSCTQHPIQRFVSYGNLSVKMQSFIANSAQIQIPNTFQQAMADPKWKLAAEEELKALEENKTWEIISCPQGKKPVGCKWIFTPKFNPDGSINKYKARLVAKGYTQTYGIDYQETFAPVAKFNTIQVLLSIAANLDWPLHQLDIKNAFLNGDLEEEVYMEVPDGVLAPNGSVCKLNKSLYGLKQSPRAWFGRFNKAIKKLGYQQGQADDTLFVKNNDGRITILIVYVDDIVITGNDEGSITQLKRDLSDEFQVKDLGQMRYFLGMEVARTKGGINVSQRKYTLDLLHETGMLGAQPEGTPMEEGCHLEIKENGVPVNFEQYRRLVGKLIYLTHTRPDISYAVGIVSQFMHQPQEDHMAAVYRILSYLKLNPGRGIFFKKSTARNLEIYTDADHARDRETRRSTSGYCTYVWGNLVTWRSKKQTVVSKSSAEAELRAVNDGTCEGLWVIRLLKELGIPYESPMQVWCDNKASIEMTRNPVYHDRTKHVEIDRHFIKEKVEAGIMNLAYIRSADQIADVMTKPLGRTKFEGFRCKLGMIDIYSPA